MTSKIADKSKNEDKLKNYDNFKNDIDLKWSLLQNKDNRANEPHLYKHKICA